MDFKNLKPKSGERYIIIENGEPQRVILSFEDYEKLVENMTNETTENLERQGKIPFLEQAEQEKSNVSDEPAVAKSETENVPAKEEKEAEITPKELKLEDLPF